MKPDDFIRQIENYVECWKQFNQYLRLAGAKRFSEEDEEQFLELKSVLAQELELILAHPDAAALNRQEIHDLMEKVPSLHHLSGGAEGEMRQLESRWHKLYIQWQALLGQTKVKYRTDGGSKTGLGGWFR